MASPVDPPTASIPPAAATDFILSNLDAALIGLPPLVNIFAPTPPANLPVNASITPIVIPLAIALFLMLFNFSGSWSTDLTFSEVISLSPISSWSNSEKVAPISSAVLAAPNAKGIAAAAPGSPPTAAPVPSTLAPAITESLFVAMEVKELSINSGSTVSPDFDRPFTTPQKLLPSSS